MPAVPPRYPAPSSSASVPACKPASLPTRLVAVAPSAPALPLTNALVANLSKKASTVAAPAAAVTSAIVASSKGLLSLAKRSFNTSLVLATI